MFLTIFSIIEKIINNVLMQRFDSTQPVVGTELVLVGTNNASNYFGSVCFQMTEMI